MRNVITIFLAWLPALPGVLLADTTVSGTHGSANTIWIEAPAFVRQGEQFEINIIGDFGADGLVAGGVELLYEPAVLSLDAYSTDLFIDPDLSCPSAVLCPEDPGGQFSIAWGRRIPPVIIEPFAGPTVMSTITATALGVGESPLELVDWVNYSGAWFAAGFTLMDTPMFVSTTIKVTSSTDADGDTIADSHDNCQLAANAGQQDTDADGIGNACDPDFTNNCQVAFDDIAIMKDNFFLPGNLVTDLNSDGMTNFADAEIMLEFVFGPPGPSGLPNACSQ